MKPKSYFLEKTFPATGQGFGYFLMFVSILVFGNIATGNDVLFGFVICSAFFCAGLQFAFAKTYIHCYSEKPYKIVKTHGVGKFRISSRIKLEEFKIAVIRVERFKYIAGRFGQDYQIYSGIEHKESTQGLFLVKKLGEYYLLFSGTNEEIKRFILDELKYYDLRYFYGSVKPGQELKFESSNKTEKQV